ncbi:hypothetical protein H5410_030550 [Solanum commersonii]|uniref:Putative plant transposon protein domain-containing protein n=1 Tax=Solanum commersonii TaxID=4109 RepID=A0A9J5YJ10_SOLCO|nr:hypothetical protein H5410_030550 [Solanum commersonii]
MGRLITEERRVLTGSLHTVPDIHRLFNLHKCDWMARDPGTYSEEIVWEFYASYAATLWGSISKRSKPLAQDPLTSTLVRGCPVDISPATIRRFLYSPTACHFWSLNTAEFDHRWDIVRSGSFQRNFEQREAVIHWLAKYIAVDGERAEWSSQGSGIGSRSRYRLCPHVASRDTRDGIQDLHDLPFSMPYFLAHWTSVSFEMRRMSQHLAESLRLRYLPWVPTLQT